MYLFNDMELLLNLGKLGILKHVLSQCAVSISAVKLKQGYSFQLSQQVESFCTGVQQLYTDDGFHHWKIGKSRRLSTGDLDSLYLAECNSSTIILSEDDFDVKDEALQLGIPHEPVDNFIKRIINDDHIVKLFTLFRKAQ
jgi:hypothetical protein